MKEVSKFDCYCMLLYINHLFNKGTIAHKEGCMWQKD